MNVNIKEIESSLQLYLLGGVDSGSETVHVRSSNRGGLVRLHLTNGGSVVVKLWRIRNFKERLKAVGNLSNGRREWRIHRLIYRNGINVPEPLFFQRLTIPVVGPCEIMTIEDIGETECGVPYLKQLIITGRDKDITVFEDRIIDITSELLKMRILDVDNQLNNFLVDTAGRVLRTDFECARRRRFFSLRRLEFATMLDRLLRSHLHATHPDSERTSRFMAKVATRLTIPTNIRQMVAEITRNELQRERKETGIRYAIVLDW